MHARLEAQARELWAKAAAAKDRDRAAYVRAFAAWSRIMRMRLGLVDPLFGT